MKITVLTLFPNMIESVLNDSIMKRAIENNIIEISIINFREFSTNKHKTVDDTIYGGGAGMLLQVEPIYLALQSIPDQEKALKVLLSPQGRQYSQGYAKELAEYEHIILICGHYEGFDERVRDYIDLELSIGDYVLTGGEIAALAVIDSVTRLLPGVLGQKASYEHDSFYEDSLDYPQYTKPREFMGKKVPDVLLSGNHQEIAKWREEMKQKRTEERRPDLLKKNQ